MNPTPYKTLPVTIFITLILCSSSQAKLPYDNCKETFECGDPSVIGELKFPFWGVNRANYCGLPGFKIQCINNTPMITNSTYNLRVIGSDPQEGKITVSMPEFNSTLCPSSVFSRKLTNVSFVELGSGSLYMDPSYTYRLLTILYGCPLELGHQPSWSSGNACDTNKSVSVHFVTDTVNSSITSQCLYVVVLPILQEKVQYLDDNTSSLVSVLDQGFEMKWFAPQDINCASCIGSQHNSNCKSCMVSGGECGFDWSKNQSICYCPDNTVSLVCPQSKEAYRKMKTPLIIGVSVGVVALLALLAGCFVFARRRRSQLVASQKARGIHPSISNGEGGVGGCLLIIQKSMRNPQNQSVEDSLKNYASLVPKRYAYKYIKKITRSFREKLGEGGYGMVFKGNLRDGRIVAVKVWKQSEGDGQDFLNEVMSISRTSHVNVVSLLGFCSEGHKRALIYEFMPNGSLDKFIQKRYFSENNQPLIVQKLFEICVGVARGLEYLHRGCNTRIVHFDIKPHNILLDAEFIPKISDFGLAKSSQQKESLISMSGARGTVGYIAPEVFFRMYGRVSHKSDVYSFGMMVLEMVGCKNKVNDNVENSSEMYFPQWIYKQLELGAYTIDCERILNEEEKELERKMMLVGLWCIQTNPVNRPSMSRVLEMLEGKVELLEVPPMPTLCSPPRQQQTDEDSVSYPSSTTFVPTL